MQILYVKGRLLCNLEEVLHILLFELIIISLDALVKPVWVLDFRNRIHTLLESGWNRHNLLDGAAKSLFVVIPIQDVSEVEVCQGVVLEPFFEILLFDRLL